MPLDRDLPVIESSDPPPGRFEPDAKFKGLQSWRGPLGWLTRHGAGTLQWSLGRPVRATGAVLPDGSDAGDVETLSPVERDVWRRAAAGGQGFEHGKLSIEPTALVFSPVATPGPISLAPDPDDPADMRADLAGDPALTAALAERAFADAVYDAFRGTDYRRGDEPAVFSMSYREAGAFVAGLRGRGEAYTDFFDHTRTASPPMAARVRAAFLVRGWHPVGPDEAAQLNALAATLAQGYAAKPAAGRPDWTKPFGVLARRSEDDLEARGDQADLPTEPSVEQGNDGTEDEDDPLDALVSQVDALARTGRLTRREWLALRSLALCH